MKNNMIVNISEIEELFKEDCRENKIEFSEKKFDDFLNFLKIDFYDWVNENMRSYFRDKN